MSLVKKSLKNLGLYTALAASALVGCSDSSSDQADLDKLKEDIAKAKTSEITQPGTSTYVPSVPSPETSHVPSTVTQPSTQRTVVTPSVPSTVTQPSVPSTSVPTGVFLPLALAANFLYSLRL